MSNQEYFSMEPIAGNQINKKITILTFTEESLKVNLEFECQENENEKFFQVDVDLEYVTLLRIEAPENMPPGMYNLIWRKKDSNKIFYENTLNYQPNPKRMAFFSCDLLESRSKKPLFSNIRDEKPDLIVHIGDNTYCDTAFAKCMKMAKRHPDYTEEYLLSEGYKIYFDRYKDTWKGWVGELGGFSNIFLHDDHDIINNVQQKWNNFDEKEALFCDVAFAVMDEMQYQPTENWLKYDDGRSWVKHWDITFKKEDEKKDKPEKSENKRKNRFSDRFTFLTAGSNTSKTVEALLDPDGQRPMKIDESFSSSPRGKSGEGNSGESTTKESSSGNFRKTKPMSDETEEISSLIYLGTDETNDKTPPSNSEKDSFDPKKFKTSPPRQTRPLFQPNNSDKKSNFPKSKAPAAARLPDRLSVMMSEANPCIPGSYSAPLPSPLAGKEMKVNVITKPLYDARKDAIRRQSKLRDYTDFEDIEKEEKKSEELLATLGTAPTFFPNIPASGQPFPAKSTVSSFQSGTPPTRSPPSLPKNPCPTESSSSPVNKPNPKLEGIIDGERKVGDLPRSKMQFQTSKTLEFQSSKSSTKDDEESGKQLYQYDVTYKVCMIAMDRPMGKNVIGRPELTDEIEENVSILIVALSGVPVPTDQVSEDSSKALLNSIAYWVEKKEFRRAVIISGDAHFGAIGKIVKDGWDQNDDRIQFVVASPISSQPWKSERKEAKELKKAVVGNFKYEIDHVYFRRNYAIVDLTRFGIKTRLETSSQLFPSFSSIGKLYGFKKKSEY